MTVSIGIVGAGVWAERVHLPSIAAHPDFRIAGVWARRAEQAEKLAKGFDVPAVAELSDLIGRSDVLDFAVPPAVQPELALVAARRDKHLILEKPVGTDLDLLGRLQNEVRRRRLAVSVFVNRFFDPARKATMAELASTPWTNAHTTWRSSSYLPGNPFATPWRDSGAVLFDIGPHAISQLEAILGRTVHGQITTKAPTQVDLELHHQGGATSTVHIDVGADVPALEEQLTVHGAEGTVAVPLLALDPKAAFARLLDHLAKDMQQDAVEVRTSPPATSLAEGIRTVRLLLQIACSEGATHEYPDCPICAARR
jgi:predicted dehydrogenase